MGAHSNSNAIWLERNRKMEERSNGLIIIEAYYGLDEHIYQIDAGLLQVKNLKNITIEEYIERQFVPMKQFLTIKIENSKLVISRKEFKKTSKVLFNPCISKAARTLLYVRYRFHGLEKVLIYDFSRETLTIPHDVQ